MGILPLPSFCLKMSPPYSQHWKSTCSEPEKAATSDNQTVGVLGEGKGRRGSQGVFQIEYTLDNLNSVISWWKE